MDSKQSEPNAHMKRHLHEKKKHSTVDTYYYIIPLAY